MMRGLRNTFKYPVSDLLTALEENRENHVQEYEEALGNYKEILIEELEKMVKTAKEDGELRHDVQLRHPECHVKEYDQAISMLKMTSDTEIEIDGDTFAQLVMDEWDWQHSFTANTKSFMGAALKMPGAYTNVKL